LALALVVLMNQYGFRAGPRSPDPIIDDSSKHNAYLFDSDLERAPYLRLSNELVMKNVQIDMMNIQCNLPDSVIRLDTKSGCVALRAQYPLSEAYRDAVSEQIQIWLDECVVERSASHTHFDHP
jgi:hypothetical protein